jgi:hypothetical protein
MQDNNHCVPLDVVYAFIMFVHFAVSDVSGRTAVIAVIAILRGIIYCAAPLGDVSK